jgi:hypothetical protein
METARYCYKVPLLLGQGFKQEEKGSISIFSYAINIQGYDSSFVLISPTYIGDLCQISIKLPKTNADGSVTIERRKVTFGKPETSSVEKDSLNIIFRINNYLWKHVLPDLKLDKYEVKEMDTTPYQETMFNKTSYKQLRSQYLIFPVDKDENGELKYDFKVVSKIGKKLNSKKKATEFKNAECKKYLFNIKGKKDLYMLQKDTMSFSNYMC